MNKIFYVLLISFSLINSEECFNNWEKTNFNIEYNLFLIDADINNDNHIKIYIDRDARYRIEFSDKIIISDVEKISSYSKNTNQLYIEDIDLLLNNLIFSFFNFNDLDYKVKKNNNNNYKIKKTPYGNIDVLFNDGCNRIENLKINRHKILVHNIQIIELNKINTDSLFSFNLSKEAFEYDFRE